jgi:hypothetical protein
MDGNLALLVGHIAGLLMRASAFGAPPTEVEVEVVGGNYTNRLFVTRPSGRYVVTVEKVEEP